MDYQVLNEYMTNMDVYSKYMPNVYFTQVVLVVSYLFAIYRAAYKEGVSNPWIAFLPIGHDYVLIKAAGGNYLFLSVYVLIFFSIIAPSQAIIVALLAFLFIYIIYLKVMVYRIYRDYNVSLMAFVLNEVSVFVITGAAVFYPPLISFVWVGQIVLAWMVIYNSYGERY